MIMVSVFMLSAIQKETQRQRVGDHVLLSCDAFSWSCQESSGCLLFLGRMNRRLEKQIGTVKIFQKQNYLYLSQMKVLKYMYLYKSGYVEQSKYNLYLMSL